MKRCKSPCPLVALLMILVPALGAQSSRPESLPPVPALQRVTRVFEVRTGRELDLARLIDEVHDREAVFLGETHLDDVTHRVELAIYEGLVERLKGRVVLAMEMFERDVQPVLDAYVAGKLPEGEFLRRSRPWSNYRTGYRALIELARRRKLPVVASNLPAMLRRRIARGGPQALDALPAGQRGWAPTELFDNSDAYWERFGRTLRGGHLAGLVADRQRRRSMGQTLWDNTMGESCALALKRHPESLLLHVNGGFHSQYHEGTVYQLLKRRPGTRACVVDIAVSGDLAAQRAPRDRRVADYVVYTEGRARGFQDGYRAVRLGNELRYRQHVPTSAAGAAPPPLLIWLHDDGQQAADGLAVWRAALGREAAIIAVEAPYPELADDLAQAGRWFWPASYREDLPVLQSALGELAAYVVRHFPVDGRRVVLAGSGTGATVVAAAVTLGSGQLPLPAVAAGPRRYERLHELSMPEPAEVRAGSSLHVLADAAGQRWWAADARSFSAAGMPSRVSERPAGGWESHLAAEAALREALGLKPAEPAAGSEGAAPVLLVHRDGSPRAARWALRQALALRAAGTAARPIAASALVAFAGAARRAHEVRPLAFSWESLALPTLPAGWRVRAPYDSSTLKGTRGIPLAPGSFGGTTVLVLPGGVPEAQRLALQQLVSSGAIRRRSRFAGLKLAGEDAPGPSLERVLGELGGGSVLVVPAVYCAGEDLMLRLRARTRALADRFDLSFRPGLGATLDAR